MITKYLDSILAPALPALANHLWQSTAFLLVAWLLTLTLRRYQARARYWLWLAASVKFIVPFSLLVELGRYFGWSRPMVTPEFYFAMEEVTGPFTRPEVSQISSFTPSSLAHFLSPIVAVVWPCGLLLVLLVWAVRWRRVAATLRMAVALREGREAEALRRIERTAGIRKSIQLMQSRSTLEPGIFGVFRPVLIWTAGISEHLNDEQLEAVLEHEVWHVRRYDNLAALLHMFVEAVFWFHPLVWWLGARLLEERERACDEEVVRSGSQRQVYAESILKVCEFCLGSPLVCVSGVTGADLKKRMVHIMTDRMASKLNFSRKFLLSAMAFLAIAVPVIFGVFNATPGRAQSSAGEITPGFKAVSIKADHSTGDVHFARMMHTPEGVAATGATLSMLMGHAYGVEENQISTGLGWIKNDRFNLEIKLEPSTLEELQKLPLNQSIHERQRLLQELLADYFKLKVHQETKVLPQYALVAAESGPRLQEAKPADTYLNGLAGPDGGSGAGIMHVSLGVAGKSEVVGQGIPVSNLVRLLSQQTGRNVIDQTGLTGKYDVTLRWTPDPNQTPHGAESAKPSSENGSSAPAGPTIFDALRDQLGLELKLQKGPVDVLVVDSAEKPADN